MSTDIRDAMKGFRSAPRQIARVGAGERWFPPGISEVVAHTDGRYITVTISRVVAGRGAVYMQEFDCTEREVCERELRWWLRGIGSLAPPVDAMIVDWSDHIGKAIADAMFGSNDT